MYLHRGAMQMLFPRARNLEREDTSTSSSSCRDYPSSVPSGPTAEWLQIHSQYEKVLVRWLKGCVYQGFPWEHVLLCHMCLEYFTERNSGQYSLCLFILKAVCEEDLMTWEWDSTINYLSPGVNKPLTQLKLCLMGYIFSGHDNQRDLTMLHFNRFSPVTSKQKPCCVYEHMCMSLVISHTES